MQKIQILTFLGEPSLKKIWEYAFTGIVSPLKNIASYFLQLLL